MIWASIVTLRTLRFLRERLDVSWLVGCLTWQVASARREWHQHHRAIRRQTKAKLRLSVTPHGPRRPRKGSSREFFARFVLKSEVGTPTHDGATRRYLQVQILTFLVPNRGFFYQNSKKTQRCAVRTNYADVWNPLH